MKNKILFLWIMLLLPTLAACSSNNAKYTSQTFAMDTIMNLTAYGPAGQQAVNEGAALIADLEKLLSTTNPESDIYALNNSEGEWVTLAPETMEALSLSVELAERSDGAFDPTIYPVLEKWGFISKEYHVPTDAELAALLPLVDYSAIELDMEQNRAKLPVGVQVDLGAVAKGYTADCVVELFAELGVEHALMSLGGNVYVMGGNPKNKPWQVGIQNPSQSGYLASMEVFDGAIVTSGGYQRYFEENGKLYWHILDPETGKPSRNTLRSVTVFADSGTESDAYSTALFVVGRQGAEAMWREDQSFEMVLIEVDGTIVITEGLLDIFTVEGDTIRDVEVLKP